MGYVKTNWVDGETPIDATNLNKMEDGIEAALRRDGGVLTEDIYKDNNSDEENKYITKKYVSGLIYYLNNEWEGAYTGDSKTETILSGLDTVWSIEEYTKTFTKTFDSEKIYEFEISSPNYKTKRSISMDVSADGSVLQTVEIDAASKVEIQNALSEEIVAEYVFDNFTYGKTIEFDIPAKHSNGTYNVLFSGGVTCNSTGVSRSAALKCGNIKQTYDTKHQIDY